MADRRFKLIGKGVSSDAPSDGSSYVRKDGEWVVSTGGGVGSVTSVFARTGDVTAAVGDYSAFYSQLGHTHATTDITSGTFADARIAESNVTQHEAALTVLETQITDGSLLARLAANETVSGTWDFTNMGDITFKTGAAGGTLRTGTSAADKFEVQAYDVDGAAYVTLLEVDAGNTVRLQLPCQYLEFEDGPDRTKIMQFDLSAITSATTRTVYWPDENVTVGNLTDKTAAETVSGAWTFSSALNLTTSLDVVGQITVSGSIMERDSTSVLNLWGGSSDGANIELYGGSHATQANNAYYDADIHTFRAQSASPTYARFDSAGITTDLSLQVGEAAGTADVDLIFQDSKGMIIEPGSTTGGWARGVWAQKRSDSSVMAGFGFLGSSEAMTSFHVGFGPSWWSTDDVFSINSTGQALHYSGTAAAPGITFLNDSTSGFYRGGAGEFSVSVSGVEQATFTANGTLFDTASTATPVYITRLGTAAEALAFSVTDTVAYIDHIQDEVDASTHVITLRNSTGASGTHRITMESSSTEYHRFYTQGSGYYMYGGGTLRVYDGTNADSISISHDGTDANFAMVGTTDLNITGITALKTSGGIYPESQTVGYIRACTGSFGSIEVAGADGSSGTWSGVSIGGEAVFMSNLTGVDSTNRFGLYNDIGNRWAIQYNANGDGEVGVYCNNNAGSSVVTLQTRGYDILGVTSGAQAKDHGGTYRDVGFNVLKDFNNNASDTLEAQHCGAMAFTNNSTAYTLTLCSSTDLDFPINGVTTVVNAGTSGNYTITEGTSTTLYFIDPGVGRVDTAGGCTVGPGGVATIWRESATVYYIWGSEITA